MTLSILCYAEKMDDDLHSKQKFLDSALPLFAERGYYGVSLADVADDLGMTKQAVLYHFRTKEALYGAVMKGISERFEAVTLSCFAGPERGEARLRIFLTRVHHHLQDHPMDARIIVRELLDNVNRAKTSQKWYLKRFLQAAIALLDDVPAWSGKSADERTAALYQYLGAINYFAISDPTLVAIWGEERVDGMKAAFLNTLL